MAESPCCLVRDGCLKRWILLEGTRFSGPAAPTPFRNLRVEIGLWAHMRLDEAEQVGHFLRLNLVTQALWH